MGLDIIRHFITESAKYDMPTRFLTRVINEYEIDFDSGSGLDHTSQFWNTITFFRSTWEGLRRRGFADSSSVQTLYHEATHAYFDLEDYGEEDEFGEAMQYYEMAKLANGNYIYESDTERAVDEAAGAYVGHRASRVWMAWSRLDFFTQVLADVSAGKFPVAKGRELILATGPFSIPQTYARDMQRRVFGYVESGGDQSEIASKPIPYKLRDHCDRVLLENKISDNFHQMVRLKLNFETLYKSMTQFPSMAAAMIGGSTPPQWDGRGMP